MNEQTCDYCGKEISLEGYYNLGGCCSDCANKEVEE